MQNNQKIIAITKYMYMWIIDIAYISMALWNWNFKNEIVKMDSKPWNKYSDWTVKPYIYVCTLFNQLLFRISERRLFLFYSKVYTWACSMMPSTCTQGDWMLYLLKATTRHMERKSSIPYVHIHSRVRLIYFWILRLCFLSLLYNMEFDLHSCAHAHDEISLLPNHIYTEKGLDGV